MCLEEARSSTKNEGRDTVYRYRKIVMSVLIMKLWSRFLVYEEKKAEGRTKKYALPNDNVFLSYEDFAFQTAFSTIPSASCSCSS